MLFSFFPSTFLLVSVFIFLMLILCLSVCLTQSLPPFSPLSLSFFPIPLLIQSNLTDKQSFLALFLTHSLTHSLFPSLKPILELVYCYLG
uniref:Uncharacterized protein n=1 Tax=Octopus bimaculoides TaxID=37653 RepID=A0A0L8HPK7_OCTBM